MTSKMPNCGPAGYPVCNACGRTVARVDQRGMCSLGCDVAYEAGQRDAYAKCAAEARRREEHADVQRYAAGHNRDAETAWTAKSSAFDGMAEWAEREGAE